MKPNSTSGYLLSTMSPILLLKKKTDIYQKVEYLHKISIYTKVSFISISRITLKIFSEQMLALQSHFKKYYKNVVSYFCLKIIRKNVEDMTFWWKVGQNSFSALHAILSTTTPNRNLKLAWNLQARIAWKLWYDVVRPLPYSTLYLVDNSTDRLEKYLNLKDLQSINNSAVNID